MDGHLEVWAGGKSNLVSLGLDDVSIGRGNTNVIALPSDKEVSRLHAVIARYPGGWTVRDVGSVNGTFLNGKRIDGEQFLRRGDEIGVGTALIIFRGDLDGVPTDTTWEPGTIPDLTPAERRVLVALCRPRAGGMDFAEPASNHEIAKELSVKQATVKFHLQNLYRKFKIWPGEGSQRVRLANEAIRRRAVSRAELQRHPTP
jgi:hypothetical protein